MRSLKFFGPVNFKRVIRTALLAGLLDGTGAIINYLLKGGEHPEKIFNFIASGFFGKAGLTGGTEMVIWGIVFHFIIAICWTILFFYLYPRMKWMSVNAVLTGIIYGFFIWLVMTRIVLPLSLTPVIPFQLKQALVAIFILIVAMGMPLSFTAAFSKKSCRKTDDIPNPFV